MSFGHPELLFLLWLIPVAGLVLWGSHVRRVKRLALVAGFQGHGPRLVIPARVVCKSALCLLAMVALIVALAQPRWGFKWLDVKGRGSDLIIAVDVSSSMLAQDINPSRLERAKREVLDLLPALKGDRVGLVAFAGDAFIECPLTEDYAAVRMFISYLAPDLIPMQGTDLGEAIKTSMRALFDGSPDGVEGRAILLITDGEDQEQNAAAAVAEAKEKGVRIYTVGIGSAEGAPIPLPDGGFKKDVQGNMVVTKPDEQALAKVAVESGGVFVRSVTGGMDLAQLYAEHIHKDVAQREFQTSRQKLWFERFQWFLALALAALIAEFSWRDVRRTALWLVGGVALLSAAARVQAQAEISPKERYNSAVQAYQKGDLAGAVAGFKAAGESNDQALAERSLFNLGTTQAQMGQFDEAVKSYENALALKPDDQEVRDNLGVVKQALEEQKKQQQQQQQQGGKDQKDQKDQKDGKDGQDQKGQEQKPGQEGPSGEPGKQQQGQKDGQEKQGAEPQGKQANQDSAKDAQAKKSQDSKDGADPKEKQAAAQPDPKGKDSEEHKAGQDAAKPDDAGAKTAAAAEKEAGKEGKDGKEQAQAAPGAANQSGGKNPAMSPEDAEKLLRSVDDQVKRYLYAPRSKRPPRSRERDW